MPERSWAATVRLVRERADGCCEYCRTCESVIGQTLHIEHIDPKGGDSPDNLCLACPTCNLSKATATRALDPQTRQRAALFNPRKQTWSAHFRWIDDGLRVEGLTPTGRATVIRLKMNLDRVVAARSLWIRIGIHPPG
jgi:hypothetical protein